MRILEVLVVVLHICNNFQLWFVSSADYGRDGDPTDMLPRYHARLEARCYGNMEEVRFLWDDVMTRHGREAQYWLEYAELERFVSLSVCLSECQSVVCLEFVVDHSLINLYIRVDSPCKASHHYTHTHTHTHTHHTPHTPHTHHTHTQVLWRC